MELKPVNMWIALLFIKARYFFSSFLCRHFHDSTCKWLKEPQADVQEIREAAQRSPLSLDGGESTFSSTPKASWLPIMRNGSVAGVVCACSPPQMQLGIQVKPVVAAAAILRVRLPLPWLPHWMLQKRPSEAKNHRGMRNRELLGGWETGGEPAANRVPACNDA